MEPSGTETTLIRGKSGRILIVADDFRLRTLLFAFLSSMGPRCIATDSREALAHIERESFDVVLVDSHCSKTPGEQLLLAMEGVAPQLWGRVLVIADDVARPHAPPLIPSYFLPPIPRSQVFQQLWPTLQPFFTSWRAQEEAPQWSRIGRLIFDSFQQPRGGVRAAAPASARQLVYEHDKVMVDLVIEPLAGFERIALGGQVLNFAEPESKAEKIPVVLVPRERPVITTRTNRFGEFSLEFDFVDTADLRVRPAERYWMAIPSIDMAWAKDGGM